jgi:outer membrane autotransporter protein
VVCNPQAGYGVWVKGIGSWTNRDASQSVYTHNHGFTFDLGYKQDIYGVLAGVDWTRTGPLDTAQVGIMGGYVDSKLKFNSGTAPTKFDYSGGMVGVTATYINRGWFVDGLFKADFLNLDINMPSVAAFSGGSNTGVNVTNLGGMGNAGYRWQFNPTWYLEGIATLAYVSTQIDNAVMNGTTVQWADGKSFRGAIGGRVGTLFNGWGTKRVEASLTGRVWNEWEGKNSATLVTAGPAFEVIDDGMHNKPFGEVVGMLDVANIGVGWSGFVNAGVKFNDDFTTTTAKGGVRYQW